MCDRLLNPFGGGLSGCGRPSADSEVDPSGGDCRIDIYFLPGNAEYYECLCQPVRRLWNASGQSFRLVDSHFDPDRLFAGIRGLIHSFTVPPRSNEHSLEGFGVGL